MKATMMKKPIGPGPVKYGSKATIIRNKKGAAVGRIEKEDYAGVNESTLHEDREYMASKMSSSPHFDSGPSPRVGGKASNTQGGIPMGGSKKQVYKAKMRVKKSAASPQAKFSAKKLYK